MPRLILFFFLAAFAQGSASPLIPPIIHPSGGTVRSPWYVTITNLNSQGVIFFTLDGSDPADHFGKVVPQCREYTDPITMNKSGIVRARVKVGANWSDLTAARFTADQDFSKLLITEVMFHSVDHSGNFYFYDFLEFKNIGIVPLDMSSFELWINETGPNSEKTAVLPPAYYLPPGAYGVIAGKAQPEVAYNMPAPPAAVLTFEFNHDADIIKIRAPGRGATAAKMAYDTHSPWQVVPDNHGYFVFSGQTSIVQEVGFSLERVSLDLNLDSEDYRTWRASAKRYGTPGRDNTPPDVPPIYINEILSRPNAGAVDTIELFNPNNIAVDLGGWWLSDERNRPYKHKIPPNTVVPAQGYLLLNDATFGSGTNGFSLSADGDRCYLFSGDANGNLTGYSHGAEFGGAEKDMTFGRFLTSHGIEHFWPQQSSTLGGPNSGPRGSPVVFSEINFHPGGGEPEFIELRNISSSPVQLWDPGRPASTWAVGFQYISAINPYWVCPTNVTIPGHGIILIVQGDTNSFRSRYNVPTEIPIFPFIPGIKISNSGETIYVLKPNGADNGAIRFVAMDVISYKDRAPWPPAADGSGQSLERINGEAFGDDPANWRANPSGITPGRHTATNLAPKVWAGGPRVAFVNRPITLTGLVDDDQWPGRTVSSTWTISGALQALRPNPGGLTNYFTTQFSQPGLQRATFTATDGEYTSTDQAEIQVIVRPYEEWLKQKFSTAELSDPAIVGEKADPDHDGLTNLEEYLFDTDPKSATGPGIMAAEIRGDRCAVSWTQRLNAPDVEVVPEYAHDLNGPWFGGPGLFQIQETTLADGISKRVTVLLSSEPISASTAKFLRLSFVTL